MSDETIRQLIATDWNILDWFRAFAIHSSWVQKTAQFFSSWVIWVPVSIAAIAWMFAREYRKVLGRILVIALAIGCADFVCGTLLKKNLVRVRPCLTAPARVQVAEKDCGNWFSFPSNHAANAAAFAMAITLTASAVPALPGLGLLLVWLFAFGAAISRLLLGVHFPSDVAAGMVVGIFSAILARAVLRNPWLRDRLPI